MKKRIMALILVVAQLFMAWSMSVGVSAASVRSARKVLKDIVSVKEEWDNAETQEERSKLHEEADELREELLLTKEYTKDIKVSDRNFLLSEGEDPGFRKMVDVLCFKPYDSKENIKKVLNYLDAYDESFWGTICIVCGGIIFTGALTYGVAATAPKVIAGAGMKVAEWETAVSGAIEFATNEANKINHVMLEKHAWTRLILEPTWNEVSKLISQAFLYGEEINHGNGVFEKLFLMNGETISVTYKIVNGALRLSDAWLVTD